MTETFIDKIIHFRWRIIALFAVIWIGAIVSAWRLSLDEDVFKLLPDSDPQMAQYRLLLDQFNPMNAMLIDIAIDSSLQNRDDILIEIGDRFYNDLHASHLFDKITYRWSISDLQKAMQSLMEHRALLFTRADSLTVQKKLDYTAITGQLGQWKQTLAESPSPFLARQLLEDPLNLNEFLQHKLQSMQAVQGNVQVYRGRLFSKNQDHLLMIAQPRFKSTDNRRAREMLDVMDRLIRKYENSPEAPVQIAYVAAHRFTVENARRIKADIQWTVSLALAAIILLTLLVYSRPALMLLTLLPALFGSAVSLGILHWILPDISAIVIGSGAVLIGITVDYGIHFIYHSDQIKNPANRLPELKGVFQALLRPLLLGASTTLIAFLTLQFSAMPAFRQLSLFVSLGISAALLFVLFIFPVILSRPQLNRKRDPFWALGNIFPPLFAWTLRKRLWILSAAGLITVLLIPGFMKLQFDGDVQNLNAVSPKIEEDVQRLTRTYGNVLSSTLVMVSATTWPEALHKNEILHRELNSLSRNGWIESFSNMAGLLPSPQQQEENRRRWLHVFNAQNRAKLADDLNRAAGEHGLRQGLFDDFIEGLANIPERLSYEDYKGTLLGDILANFVADDGSAIHLLSNCQLSSEVSFSAFMDHMDRVLPEAVIYNGRYFVSRMISLILQELQRIGTIVLLVLIVFLYVVKRNWREVLLFLIPLLISLFWTFGIMGYGNIPINIINSIIAVFVLGLVIDYCIFLSSGLRQEQSDKPNHFLNRTGGAISISAMTTMIGLGVLIFASHPALHSLGVTCFLGVGIGLLAVLFIIPSLHAMIFINEKKG